MRQSLLIPVFLFVFITAVHGEDSPPVVEAEAFESSLVPVPALRVETTHCLIVQPTYDHLYAVFESAEDLKESRAEQVAIDEFRTTQDEFLKNLEGFTLDVTPGISQNSAVKRASLRVVQGEPLLEIEWLEEKRGLHRISDPRVLILLEDFLSLVRRSELDRYEGILLEPFEIGDVSLRFRSHFNERTHRIPEPTKETDLKLKVSKDDESLSYDLSKSLYGWLYRLEAADSELPHRSADQLCVRFQCDQRNVMIDRNDPVLKENQATFSDFVKQINRLIRDHSRELEIDSTEESAEEPAETP